MTDYEQHKEFLLNALRCGSLRAKLMDNELTSIGIALKADLIGPDMAVRWAHEMGVMFLIEPLPSSVGLVAKQDIKNNEAAE